MDDEDGLSGEGTRTVGVEESEEEGGVEGEFDIGYHQGVGMTRRRWEV